MNRQWCLLAVAHRGNPGKTGHSGNMGNGSMQRIVLPQSVFSLPTSVAACADYCTNQLVCNSSRGLTQSLVILSFDPLLTIHLGLLSNNLSYFNFECREDVVLICECFSI